MKKTILTSIVLTGFSTFAAQIVLMRELMIVFYGNEISAGIILGCWLIWGGVGSFLGRWTDKVKSKPDLFANCLLIVGVILFFSVWEIRSLRSLFNSGEIVGCLPMIFISSMVLAPLCALSGFMFSLVCEIYENEPTQVGEKAGLLYSLESLGAMLGGALTSFVLIRFLDPITMALVLGSLNIFVSFFVRAEQRNSLWIFLCFSLVVFALLALKPGENLDRYLRQKQWQGYKVIDSKNSIYGNITLIKNEDQYSFFNNGLHLYEVPDRLASEEGAHFPLLEHNRPREVLLVGGGVSGVIKEILKHPVRRIDYLELDPVVMEMAEKYLPAEETKPLKNDKVAIFNQDGRFFIKRAHHKYDVIIIHIGNVQDPQGNKYYSIEFFKEVKRILNEGGVFSLAVDAPESPIDSGEGDSLRSIYAGLKGTFEDVLVVPGSTVYFLACNKAGLLTYDHKLLADRMRERNMKLECIGERYLSSRFSAEAAAYMPNIFQRRGGEIVHDFQPASHYQNMLFWTTRFGGSYSKKFLDILNRGSVRNAIFGICVLIALICSMGVSKSLDFFRGLPLLALIITGFSAAGIQIIGLSAFQIIYGYVFYHVGILLTVFMMGLAVGSFYALWRVRHLKDVLNPFIGMQLVLFAMTVSMPSIFRCLFNSNDVNGTHGGAYVIFPLLSMTTGAIVGAQFTLVRKMLFLNSKNPGKTAGMVYGIDLLGSCFGAFFTSIFLLPVLGVMDSLYVIGTANLSILVALFFGRFRYRNAY